MITIGEKESVLKEWEDIESYRESENKRYFIDCLCWLGSGYDKRLMPVKRYELSEENIRRMIVLLEKGWMK